MLIIWVMRMINVLKIVNTHGTRGEVKALHYTDGEEFFSEVSRFYTKDCGRIFELENWRFHKGAVLLKFRGVEDMSSAELLRGLELYAKEEDLPALPEGRYYYFQLVGLDAVLENGELAGKITDVIESADRELLELTRPNGKKCLIPKCDAFVGRVDLAAGQVHITPIEGLIDDEI